MKIYYINLDRSFDRRSVMESMYPWINRIEAYDGKVLKKYNDIVIPSKTTATMSELGCTFSHIKAIITAYMNGDDGAIIMEDDIYDTYKSKWTKSINDIVLNAPSDADCVILHCVNGSEVASMLTMDSDYSKWNLARWSCGAYYINKNGMRKIYDVYFKNGEIKLVNTNTHQPEPAIYTYINSYNYTKPLFIHQTLESTLHPSHLKLHKSAYDEIVKYFSSIGDNKTVCSDTASDTASNSAALQGDVRECEYKVDRKSISMYIRNKTTPVEPYKQTQRGVDSDIPRNIYMIWHSPELPPIMKTYIDAEIKDNPEFNFFIYDLDKCRKFIADHFRPDVLNAFDKLEPIAYKSDLWRYCVLYVNGGIYLDIKFMPVDGFKFIDIIDKERIPLDYHGNFWENNTFGMYNGLIVAKSGNQILHDCIENIVDNVNNKFYGLNALYPTGSGLLGKIYFKYKQRYDDIDLFFTGFILRRYTIQLGKNIILKSYPEYQIERKLGGQIYYTDIYKSKNIYSEKNTQLLN